MFLAPWFLAGLAALGVPIWIHLMRSPVGRTIDFPTLRFLKICQSRAVRRTRLKHFLLLLMRMLLLALVILGLAQPWRQNTRSDVIPNAPVSMVIVLDDSFSMGYVDNGVRRFDAAKQAAKGLINTLEPGDELMVLLMHDAVEPFVREWTTDHQRVTAALDELDVTARPTDAQLAVQEALRLAETAGRTVNADKPANPDAPAPKRNREIHILTDMQAQGWQSVIDSGVLRRTATEASIFITNFGRANAANSFITQATVVGGGFDRSMIQAQVQSVGTSPPGNIVTLSIDGKPVAQQSFEVRPGQPAEVQLPVRLTEPGVYPCELSLQDDHLNIDDRYHFTVRVANRTSLLLVDGDASVVASLSDTFYLRAALEAAGAASDVADIDMTTLEPSDLPNYDLADVGVIILCNVGQLDGAALINLETFLQRGGSLMIFAGNKVRPQVFNQWQFRPIDLTGPVGDPSKSVSFPLGEINTRHPLFARRVDLRAARFFVAMGSDENTLKDDARIAARFVDGTPALVTSRFGAGKVVLFTSSADLDWNNLPLRRAFVPWLFQTLAYLSNQGTRVEAFMQDQPVEFRGPLTAAGQPVVVTDPSGRSVNLNPQVQGGFALATFNDTSQPGFYQVQASDELSNSKGFGVNLPATESEITMLDPRKIIDAAPAGMVKIIDARETSVVQQVQESREGKGLWEPLFMLAVLLLLLESVIAGILSRHAEPSGSRRPLVDQLQQRRTLGV